MSSFPNRTAVVLSRNKQSESCESAASYRHAEKHCCVGEPSSYEDGWFVWETDDDLICRRRPCKDCCRTSAKFFAQKITIVCGFLCGYNIISIPVQGSDAARPEDANHVVGHRCSASPTCTKQQNHSHYYRKGVKNIFGRPIDSWGNIAVSMQQSACTSLQRQHLHD